MTKDQASINLLTYQVEHKNIQMDNGQTLKSVHFNMYKSNSCTT